MARAKWERYVFIGIFFGVIAYIVSLLGSQFTPLVWLFSIAGLIFIVVGVLIITKFLK